MRTLRITIAYDGAGFAGWQVQPSVRTVQGELESAFERLTGERSRITGASRTDAGVHALAQVASVSTRSGMPCPRLRSGLDALTGDDLVPIDVADAPAGFDARRWSVGKLYRYEILNASIACPFRRGRVWHIRSPLDADAMRAAAGHLVGTHDFSSFRAASCGARGPVREMRSIDVGACGEMLRIELDGSGFLHNMARIIVGTLVDAGRRRIAPDRVAAILAARDRAAAGRTAPPHGLHLVAVRYP